MSRTYVHKTIDGNTVDLSALAGGEYHVVTKTWKTKGWEKDSKKATSRKRRQVTKTLLSKDGDFPSGEVSHYPYL